MGPAALMWLSCVRKGWGIEPLALSLELNRPFGPIPSANPTPLGSPFPRKGPRAVSMVCYGCRVIRNPTAAEPL